MSYIRQARGIFDPRLDFSGLLVGGAWEMGEPQSSGALTHRWGASVLPQRLPARYALADCGLVANSLLLGPPR